MDERRAYQLFNDDTGKYQDPTLDSVFMAAISEVYLAIQEAGYEPYDQLTGFVRTGNDQYITRRRNARKIVTEMDPEMIKLYLKRYGHMYVVKNNREEDYIYGKKINEGK